MTNSSINLARPSGLFLKVETLQPVDAVLSNPALREVHLYAARRPTVARSEIPEVKHRVILLIK